MKKLSIVNKPTINIIPNASKYYGVSFNRGAPDDYTDRGFITRPDWKSGTFSVKSMNGVTNGNGWYHYQDSSLCNLVLKILNGKHNVFEFNTCQELSLWLAMHDVAKPKKKKTKMIFVTTKS